MIDEDQGKSGAKAKTRTGFARLLKAVAQGLVGIVIALEVTRLSRNSLDWHYLLYLCRFTGTLIADEHTIYDPDHATDRLVLGIRGQMSELEVETSIVMFNDFHYRQSVIYGEICWKPLVSPISAISDDP